MKRKILPRICFIGCGAIAAKHTKILRSLYPKMEISFASRGIANAKEYAARFRGSHYFGNYEDSFRSDAVDIVFITTPHAQHAEFAAAAAANGKDIIIEKPVTRNTKELSVIEKAVRRGGVRCAVAENYYYKPVIGKIKEYISSGLIGDTLFIDMGKTNRDSISGWRTDPVMMGGGALLEGGVHWVNALVSLAGSDPKSVIAVKPEIRYETNVPFEDSIMLTVRFANGVAGKLLHSWRIPNPLKGMGLSKIYGTEGVITFESNGLFYSVYGRKKRLALINPLDFLGFKAMHRAFIEDYLLGKPWEPSLERIKTELKLVEAAYKSLKSRRFEDI